ncbi:MAG: DUF3106 domain-containing protein [Thermodesulforhabdaceae bacterium]
MTGRICRILTLSLIFALFTIVQNYAYGSSFSYVTVADHIKIAQNPYTQQPYDRYQRWEQLSPREREELRQRWRRYQNLPPREQQLIQKRYEEWKQLPPEDQRYIREKLKRWEELTPEERELIRQRFRR